MMPAKITLSRLLYIQKQLKKKYDHLFNAAAIDCKITRPEADVLVFLANHPQYDTAIDVARYSGFSKAYISKAVEPLLQKKLITIKTDKDDRRYQHLYLTEKVTPLLDKLLESQRQFALIITKGISDDEKSCVISVVEKILDNVQKF